MFHVKHFNFSDIVLHSQQKGYFTQHRYSRIQYTICKEKTSMQRRRRVSCIILAIYKERHPRNGGVDSRVQFAIYKERHPRNGFVVRLFYEITCLLEAYKIIANSLRSNSVIILYYAARTSLRTALNSCRGCWMPFLFDCCLYRFLRWIAV